MVSFKSAEYRRWNFLHFRTTPPDYSSGRGEYRSQKIDTHLIPEQGMTFDPPYTIEARVDNRISRVLAHVVGKTSVSSRVVEATSTGALKVADTGSGLESYTVHSGTCGDAYAAGQTHETTDGWDKIELIVETFDAVFSFKNSAGTWGSDKILPVGRYVFDFAAYGVKFKNRVAGNNAIYEITGYY